MGATLAQLLVPLGMVLAGAILVAVVLRWALREKGEGAAAKQKLEDLSKVSARESNAQDQLSAQKPNLAGIVARWRRRVESHRRVRRS